MADTFALNLKQFADKAGENARQVVRQVSIDLLTRIVLRTPVGNPSLWKGKPPAGYVGGRARANWAVSIGTSNHAVTDRIDKSGQPTIDRGSATILSATSDAPIYIMNSLPYIRPLEYEGHSKQAPAGMVRVSVTEFQTFVDNAVKALPK
ncbi:MAG TPA: hypothetical protein VGE88_01025 [Lysobacter sp.]